VAALTCLIPAAPAAAQSQRLRGDEAAVVAVERMLEAFGGAEAWAEARTLYLEYRVQRTEPDEDLTERAWRDLQRPNQRIEMQSPSAPFVWVFSEGGGWVERDGATRELSDAGRLSALGFWPYDFYTMLHRFAAADPHLVLSLETPRRVRVRSGIGEDLGWWEIDSRGALLRWGAMSDGEPLEYVYGPIRSFGAINFPAWGAATDGSWRFDYTTVTVSPAPIDPALLDPTG